MKDSQHYFQDNTKNDLEEYVDSINRYFGNTPEDYHRNNKYITIDGRTYTCKDSIDMDGLINLLDTGGFARVLDKWSHEYKDGVTEVPVRYSVCNYNPVKD